MRHLLVLAIYFVSIYRATGQNLVPNPSFETFTQCPDQYLLKYRKELVPGWYLPTGATPDYFNSCTRLQVSVPENFMGYCLPKDGQAYAGIITLYNPPIDSLAPAKVNYREYLESKLTKPLEKGKTYRISMYYALATYSTFATNRLGIYVSRKMIRNRRSTGVLSFMPQVFMDTVQMVTEKAQWHELTGIYKATGGEQYIILGNFFNDRQTRYQMLDIHGISLFMQNKIRQNKIAYYYIDMVSVTETDDKKK